MHIGIDISAQGIAPCGSVYTVQSVGLSSLDMFYILPISNIGIFSPLIRTIKFFDEPFREQSLKITHQNDVVFAVEIDPAFVAVL
jgi:hypothetical protein